MTSAIAKTLPTGTVKVGPEACGVHLPICAWSIFACWKSKQVNAPKLGVMLLFGVARIQTSPRQHWSQPYSKYVENILYLVAQVLTNSSDHALSCATAFCNCILLYCVYIVCIICMCFYSCDLCSCVLCSYNNVLLSHNTRTSIEVIIATLTAVLSESSLMTMETPF